MIQPFMDILPDISIGKILIQRDEKTAQPVFFYEKLPTDIKKAKRIFLCDPMLATGGSASMAISKIKESGCVNSSIVFINLISCEIGINRIKQDHPDVKIITACVDPILND